jgi:DNA polymerase III delta subunit
MAGAVEHSEKFDPSHRIIVLHGSERFLIEEFTRKIAEMLDKNFGGIEQFHFDGASVEPAVVLDELRSYGLMQRHKMVVLDNADQFLSGKKSASDDEDGDDGDDAGSRRPLMERYAASPVADATLVMRSGTWRKGKLDAVIAKCGSLIACEEQPVDRAARWCVNRCAKRYDAKIDLAAADLMVSRLGPSLQRLDTELLKLASMVGSGGAITSALVEEQIAPSREEKAWAIQSAVASGSAHEMLARMHDLTSVSRQEWVPISWAVIDLMRKEHAASHLIRRNMNQQSIARQLRMWGDSIDPVLMAAKRHEPARFAQLLRDAIRTDHHSKSGLGEPQRNLEALMVKIADVTRR